MIYINKYMILTNYYIQWIYSYSYRVRHNAEPNDMNTIFMITPGSR